MAQDEAGYAVNPTRVIDESAKIIADIVIQLAMARAAFNELEEKLIDAERRASYLAEQLSDKGNKLSDAEVFAVDQQMKIDAYRAAHGDLPEDPTLIDSDGAQIPINVPSLGEVKVPRIDTRTLMRQEEELTDGR